MFGKEWETAQVGVGDGSLNRVKDCMVANLMCDSHCKGSGGRCGGIHGMPMCP